MLGQIFSGTGLPLALPAPERAAILDRFFEEIDNPVGWEKMNAHHRSTNYPEFLESLLQSVLHGNRTRPSNGKTP